MARKIVAQEECMFCHAQPCVCAKQKKSSAEVSPAALDAVLDDGPPATTDGGAPAPHTNSGGDGDG